MEALDRFIGEQPPECLYHYTGAAGVIGIVQSGQLWATDYRHLNDRKEYRIGARLLQEELRASRLTELQRKRFDSFVSHTQKGCFVLSFSEKGDQLSQWRAYCPGGNGYALGFGRQNGLFHSAKQHSFNLIRCEYSLREQQKLCRYLIDSFMEAIISKPNSLGPASTVEARLSIFLERYRWNLALALVMSALKHGGFKEEREWRLVSQYPEESLYGVSFRTGRFGVTPYFRLPLTMGEEKRPEFDEVTIGPTPNIRASREALNLLLSKSNAEVGSIRISRTPLRH